MMKKKRITDKSKLFKNLGDKPYIPKTYTFKYYEEFNKISQKLISDSRAWIFKPDKAFAGEGIFILKKEEFQKIKLDKRPYWTMQEYIENPLLIDGKKFHMRVIYLYRPKFKGIWFRYIPLYLAKKDFVYDNFDDKEIHISHYSEEQKPLYIHDLKLSKKEFSIIIEEIRQIILDLNETIKNAVCYEGDSKYCYEIFGIDLMLTKDLKVKLIEVNSKLGFKEFKKDEYKFNKKLLESEISKTIDIYLPPKYKEKNKIDNFC